LVVDRTQDNLQVALKHISGESNEVRIETIRNEFQTLSQLEHKNLLGVFDFGALPEGKGHYYTSEFVDGKNLREAAAGIISSNLILCFSILQMTEVLGIPSSLAARALLPLVAFKADMMQCFLSRKG